MEDFNEGVDGKLASRMRKVNPEQFHTLVKMHLSFELDLNAEDSDCITEKAKLKKWSLLNFTKRPKSAINLHKGAECANLSEDGINQVKQLIEYLSTEQSIEQEGIFRRTGKLTRQQDLKTALYQGLPLHLDEGKFSVHDCASVLKGFLAELPEPLLTDLHYPAHCQIAELCSVDVNANDARLLRSLQLLLLLLPSPNRILLKCVLNLLNKTATFEHKNKMNCDTLATLFTPHLMCPRKLSPEALHINSQTLSCLVAFMIRKGVDLFEIPPKLATDIRAYWVEQERKLLSPKSSDLNESVQDTTGTARTVFSFVDHKLTAKANSTQDTQAALAQLYAHIQAMPESAKKRRLVKQFNKENGQGTPRQVKHCRTKSLGDSIKKHIFQKKILGNKKLIDINIGCNITRSSSEENVLSATLEKSFLPGKARFSKSDDELSMENCDIKSDNLVRTKHISNSTGSLNTPTPMNFKGKRKAMLLNFVNITQETEEEYEQCEEKDPLIRECEEPCVTSPTDTTDFVNTTSVCVPIQEENLNNDNVLKSVTISDTVRACRQLSEPSDMYSSQTILSESHAGALTRQNSEPVFPISRGSNNTPKTCVTNIKASEFTLKLEPFTENACEQMSPVVKNRFRNMYAAHTSTPSNLLRRSLVANDYMLTPITNNDKSMSPITQSATKMTKAMQETMMTPRSRKPVMMISGSNLCNLAAAVNGSWSQHSVSGNLRNSNVDVLAQMNCSSILEESQRPDSTNDEFVIAECDNVEDKENVKCEKRQKRNLVARSIADDYCTVTQQQDSTSITSTFREYLLSRSVLTASPVDLSFTSRTGDFEQSESDLNILNQDGLSNSLLCCLDGNNPESDTSGIGSASTNSINSSMQKNESISPRKRGTSLQRRDSKKSIKDVTAVKTKSNSAFKQKQLSESTLNSVKVRDAFQETSF